MSKKVIKAGSYRIVASTNICKGKDVLLLDDFLANARQAQKLFANSLKKEQETVIGIVGIEGSSVETVQPLDDNIKPFQIIEGVKNARVFLGMDTTQSELSEELEKEKQQILQDNLVKNINTGNRIAEELANSAIQAQELHSMLENNTNANQIRDVITSAAKPRLAVQFEDGSEAVVGGGLAVPKHLSKDKPISFKNAIVLNITQRGQVKVQVSNENEDSKVKFIDFIVKKNSNEFNLLNIARVFQTKINVLLIVFERVSNSKERLELLEIENRKQILAELIGKLELWNQES